MSELESLTQTERFFWEHGGYSYRPEKETREQGRARSARSLAAAEARMKAGPYFIVVEPDDLPYDGDDSYGGPTWVVSLRGCVDSDRSEHIASMCGVAVESESDPYVRVVAAELAEEHIKEESA